MERPKISLCIAVGDDLTLFQSTLEFLSKQSLPNDEWELLVFDSTTDAWPLVKSYQHKMDINYFSYPACSSINEGFDTAEGEAVIEILPGSSPDPKTLEKFCHDMQKQFR